MYPTQALCINEMTAPRWQALEIVYRGKTMTLGQGILASRSLFTDVSNAREHGMGVGVGVCTRTTRFEWVRLVGFSRAGRCTALITMLLGQCGCHVAHSLDMPCVHLCIPIHLSVLLCMPECSGTAFTIQPRHSSRSPLVLPDRPKLLQDW